MPPKRPEPDVHTCPICPQFATDRYKIGGHLKSHLAEVAGLHESQTVLVMRARTEDDKLLRILLPTINGSTTCPLCSNATFNNASLLRHHARDYHERVPLLHGQFERLKGLIWREETFGEWSIKAIRSTNQMLTVEYWTREYIEDLAMSTSDAIDFGGAVEHDEDLSNLEIQERTAVMEELDECTTSLLQPAFQRPKQKCLTPPPSDNRLYPPELACNSLCFIQHPEQDDSLFLVCMKCETALNIVHSAILKHCRTTTHREQERINPCLTPQGVEDVTPADEHLLTTSNAEIEISSNYISKCLAENRSSLLLKPADIPLPTAVIPQLPHLKLWNVQVCECGDIHLNVKSLRAHHATAGHFGSEEKTAQQFARTCKYFLVTPAIVELSEEARFLEHLSAAQTSANQSSSTITYDSNPRAIAPWLREHRFHLLLDGKDPQVHLKSLAPVMVPSQRGSVKPASSRAQLVAIIAYVSFIDANCTRKALASSVLDLFASTFPWAQRPAGERAHLNTLEDVWTLVRYSSESARYVAYLVNLCESSILDPEMYQQLEEEEHLHSLNQAVKSFSLALTKLAATNGIEGYLSTFVTTPNLARQRQAEEAFNNPRNWQPTGNDHLDKIFRPMFTSVDAVSLFRQVLLSSLEIVYEDVPDQQFVPFSRFLGWTAWNMTTAAFFEPRVMTSRITGLCYTLRLTALLRVKQLSKSDMLSMTVLKDYHDRYLTNNLMSHFSQLYTIEKRLSSLARWANSIPQVFWIEQDGVLPIPSVHNIPVPLLELRALVHECVNKAIDIMEKELLFGGKLEDLVPSTANRQFFAESSTFHEAGKNFIDLPANQSRFQPLRAYILDQLSSNPHLRQQLFYSSAGQQIIWKPGAVAHYLRSHQEFLRHLFLPLHLLNPARRGTSWSHLALANLVGRPRGYWSLLDIGLLVSQVDKVEHVHQGAQVDPIHVVLQPLHGAIMALHAAVVPFCRLLQHQLFLAKPEIDMYCYLFTDGQARWDTKKFSKVLLDFTAQQFPPGLTVSTMRQLNIMIGRRFLSKEFTLPSLRDTNESSVFDKSSGHSTATSLAHYGVDQAYAFTTIDPSLMQMHVRCSAAYAALYDFTSPSVGITLPYGSFSQYQDPHKDTSTTTVVQHRVETLGLDIGAIVEKRVNAHLDRSLNRIVEQHLVSSGVRQLHAEHVDSFQYPETPFPLLTQLRNMLGVQKASFKSEEQAAITTHFLSCSNPSLLAVMPTGGGKTITFALPAFSERGTSTVTLVLVPFRGLAVSHLTNLKRYKVPSVYYQGETELAKLLPRQPNIIIMTYDTFVGAIAQHDLRGINTRRVVIDEAHTIHTDTSWRKVMEVVAPLVVKLGRPFLLLTGTLPVHFESSLLRQFYPSPIALVRMNTARPNLQYSINLYEEESVSRSALVMAIGEELGGSIPSHKGKWMIFVSDVAGVSKLKALLETTFPILGRISHYHGRMQPAESDPELGDWLAGVTNVIISTSALAHGIDTPHVRKVFILGFLWGVVTYVQAGARAGRDNEPSTVSLFVHRSHLEMRGSEDEEGQRALADMIRSSECRRVSISRFLDRQITSCAALVDAQPCDNCVKCGGAPAPVEDYRHRLYARIVNAQEVFEARFIEALYDTCKMLKTIHCRTCFLLQIPQSDPPHCDKDCPSQLFTNHGPTVRRWIAGSLTSNTGLASNLTLCFHCTLPQKGGRSDAMNLHQEHVPGPPGSCCDLVRIVNQVITAMLFSPRVTTAIYQAYSLPHTRESILPLLACYPKSIPNQGNATRPQILYTHVFFLAAYTLSLHSPLNSWPTSQIEVLLSEIPAFGTLSAETLNLPMYTNVDIGVVVPRYTPTTSSDRVPSHQSSIQSPLIDALYDVAHALLQSRHCISCSIRGLDDVEHQDSKCTFSIFRDSGSTILSNLQTHLRNDASICLKCWLPWNSAKAGEYHQQDQGVAVPQCQLKNVIVAALSRLFWSDDVLRLLRTLFPQYSLRQIFEKLPEVWTGHPIPSPIPKPSLRFYHLLFLLAYTRVESSIESANPIEKLLRGLGGLSHLPATLFPHGPVPEDLQYYAPHLKAPQLVSQLFAKLPQSQLETSLPSPARQDGYPRARNRNLKLLVSASHHIPIKRKREEEDCGRNDGKPGPSGFL